MERVRFAMLHFRHFKPSGFSPALQLTLLPGLIIALFTIAGHAQPAAESINPADFKTPQTAQTSRLEDIRRTATSKMGFLGVRSELDGSGRLVVAAVAADSPADKAGVKAEDIIVRVGNEFVRTPEAFRRSIQTKSPGDWVKLGLLRKGQPGELAARLVSLATVGRPMDRVRLGLRMGGMRPNGGERVEEVEPDSRGDQAGIKVGDYILQFDEFRIQGTTKVAEALAYWSNNVPARVALERDGRPLEVAVQPGPTDAPDRPSTGGRRGGGLRGFGSRTSREVLRLAIIGIEYPDVKHNPKISINEWQQQFFSTNSYTNRSATGQQAYGSINDYYLEQSAGTMRVEGKMFGWIEAARNRMDYIAATTPGSGATTIGGGYAGDALLLGEIMAKFVAREGINSLANYDAAVFLYAGSQATRVDTNVYWPHSTGISLGNGRMRYVIVSEGGERMQDISILCHELGHVLGLPDLYLRQRPNPTNATARGATNTTSSITIGRTPTPARGSPNPYAENLANWDVMAAQVGGGRPQHLSAWSKEQLGWIKPVVIDPMVRQKLVLAPIEKSPGECFKIPLRADGTEYLLLENRRRIGFDRTVPAEGLLIWRVVYGRPVLEEAHGLTGPNAARVETRQIPYPTPWNDAFTPFTKPSSAAFTGDQLPVYIRDIKRLPDGRITFVVGDGFD